MQRSVGTAEHQPFPGSGSPPLGRISGANNASPEAAIPQGTAVERTAMTFQTNPTLRKPATAVSPPADDIRGRKVEDNEGKDLGKVHDLLIDDREHKVRFLLVEHGGFLGVGETKSFIPVDAITKITAHDVFIDHSREHVALAPAYDPDLVDDRAYHSALYGHYGYVPYWGTGYSYPGAFLG